MIKVNPKKAKKLDSLFKYHLNYAVKFNQEVRESFIKYMEDAKETFLTEKEDIETIIKELETY